MIMIAYFCYKVVGLALNFPVRLEIPDFML